MVKWIKSRGRETLHSRERAGRSLFAISEPLVVMEQSALAIVYDPKWRRPRDGRLVAYKSQGQCFYSAKSDVLVRLIHEMDALGTTIRDR